MVRFFFLHLLVFTLLEANSFEENCLSCHVNEFQLNMFMKKYTLKYSSEKRIKKAIFQYLKNPTYDKSILPFGYLNRFGIKDKTSLQDKELQKMINIYYEKYNISKKIH